MTGTRPLVVYESMFDNTADVAREDARRQGAEGPADRGSASGWTSWSRAGTTRGSRRSTPG
jgi:hypothetical protein